MNLSDFMASMSEVTLGKQLINEDDYYEGDILYCGKCHTPKQRYMDAYAGDGLTKRLKFGIECECMTAQKALEQDNFLRLEREQKIKRLRESSLMDGRFYASTFSNFQPTKFNEKNLKYCKSYADRFDSMLSKSQGLIFWGGVGTGKSYAAACIANALLERQVPVIMTSFVTLLGEIQKNRNGESAAVKRLDSAKLVIFDDLGTERETDYSMEKVYEIVNNRYRSGLPMILTTNLTMREMTEDSDIRRKRIYDRIFEVCYPMEFSGPSWRKVEANKRYTEMQKLIEGA